MSSMDEFPSFQVEFLEEISDEKLCLSLEEIESEQKLNDSVRFATLNDYVLHEIVKKFLREIQDGV